MSEGFEEHVAMCKANVAHIYTMLQVDPEDWESCFDSARFVMTSIDAIPFMADPMRIEEQLWIIEVLQNLASQEADNGRLSEIALWCMRQWLVVLEHHPHHAGVLRGLAQAWVLKVRPFLERIQGGEGSSTIYSSSDEERDSSRATREAEARLHTANYVEARGMLLPAADYFGRAVRAAEVQGQLSGDLLAMAAEANISLGSVSYSTTNQCFYQQALDYLRRATQIPGYTLCSYLQQFLDEYGRL